MNKLTELVYEGEIFKIEAYITESKENLVLDWLEALPMSSQTKFSALFARLADQGKIYNEKKFKHLTGTDQLFEFKIDNKRVLSFFFIGKRVILTNSFIKKSNKTPKREIEKAEKFKKEFEQRIRHEKD